MTTQRQVRRLLMLGLCFGVLTLGMARTAEADIAVTNLSDADEGSLRWAIQQAAPGDTITFAVSGTIALTSGELVIHNNLTLVGPGPNLLTVSGEGASRVFRIVPGAIAELRDFAVRNGNGVGGGALSGGGGISNEGTLRLLNMVVAGNSSPSTGGGVDSFTAGSLTVRNSVFSDNQSASGGAISTDSHFFMIGSTIEGNTAHASGGGVASQGGTIVASTIAGNTTGSPGGGVHLTGGSLTLVNCTISGNTGRTGAGGYVESRATLTLVNTTITANNATFGIGAGLSNFIGTLVLNNSIVAGNSGSDIENDGTVVNNSSMVGGDAATVLNPTLADNGGPTLTHALVPGSPAINAGDTTFLPLDTFDVDGDGNTGEVLPIDQRGAARVFGGGVDQGAVEVVCAAVAVTPTVLSAGSVGVTYSQQIVASGWAGPYTFTATGLPPGLALDPDTGVLSGTPSTSGTYTVTVTITDGFGCSSTEVTYPLTIADPACGIVIGPASLKTPYLATLYYQQLSVTPSGQYTVTVSAGALPPGVYLFAIGRNWYLAGIPSAPGTYTFTLAAKKKNSPCAPTRTYTMIVPATVLPQLTCVAKTGGKQYTARFGYDNSTDAAVSIPVGGNNYFTPGAQDRGQVATFQKGRVTNAFSVVFTVKNNTTDLSLWYLRGPDNVRRPVNITTATSRCP